MMTDEEREADEAHLRELSLSDLLAEERERWTRYEDARLDIAIATRQGGDIDEAKKAESDAIATWGRANTQAKAAAALAVRSVLGVDPAHLKSVL
jgi:hypothetical protein